MALVTFARMRLRSALLLFGLLSKSVSSQKNASNTQLDIPSSLVVANDTWFWSTPLDVDPGMDITPPDWDKALVNFTYPTNLTIPASHNASLPGNATFISKRSLLRKRQSPPVMRIMALGASITAGVHSKPEDGYRKHIRNWLRQAGFPVNMVGSQSNPSGSMANGAHEGYPGLRILQVRDKLNQDGWLDHKPNVVIIHLGTNNCVQNFDLYRGAGDLGDMIKDIAAKVEGVHVIISTLGPLHDLGSHHRCQTVLNPGIRSAYAQLLADGYSVSLVDFGDPNGYITQADINNDDGIHPTDAGYVKYATLWYYAIREAYQANRIQGPDRTDFPDQGGPSSGSHCEKVAGQAFGPVKSQFGKAGQDDGPYSHASQSIGYLQAGSGDLYVDADKFLGDRFAFAQIYGIEGQKDRRHIQDDLLFYVGQNDPDITPGVWPSNGVIWRNLGDGTVASTRVTLDVDDGPGCGHRGVRWADVNNDGLDDYICIGAEGNMYVSINRGDAKFELIGLYKEVPAGYSQENVLIADIDGDGRADYCVTAANGDISCWRNGGTTEDKPTSWQETGILFTGNGMGDIRGTRFVDINGDGRSDWVWMNDDSGATRIFTNGRGRYDGLVPYWIEAVSAPPGLGIGFARDYTKFPRLFPRPMGTRADYVLVTETIHGRYKFQIWENLGTGGTKEKADGNRYCDMRNTGRDDLLWLKSTGEMTFWPNDNTNGHLSKPWVWGSSYFVLNINTDGGTRDRRNVHLADWNGDGMCDVIYHDASNGQAEWWKNTYTPKGGVGFEYEGWIDNAVCDSGTGVGLFDLGLRFADIDGDKRADWLCMEPDGRTHGYLNHASGVFAIGQIKTSVGHERANHRWADVNGDGRADLLWVDPNTGDTSVWENGGIQAQTISGSRFLWTPKGKQYAGQTRSGNQYYPDFDGDGRADLHKINPVTNLGETFFNICEGGAPGVDDPDTFTEAKVPADPGVDHGEPWEPTEPQCHQAAAYCDLFNCTDPNVTDVGDDGDVPLDKRQGGNGKPPAGPGGNGYSRRARIAVGPIAGFPLLLPLFIQPLDYPQWRRWMLDTPGINHVLRWIDPQACLEDDVVEMIDGDDSNGPNGYRNPLPAEWETGGSLNGIQSDHPIDLQVMALFILFALTGRHLDGTTTVLQTLSPNIFSTDWTRAHGGTTGPSYEAYIMDAFGSRANPTVFIPIPAHINNAKGRVFGLQQPLNTDDLGKNVAKAVSNNDDSGVVEALRPLQNLFGVYAYLNAPGTEASIDRIQANIHDRLQIIGQGNFDWNMVAPLWAEWWPRFMPYAVQVSYDYSYDLISETAGGLSGTNTPLASSTRITLIALIDDLVSRIHFAAVSPTPRPDPKKRGEIRDHSPAAPLPT
ncbi:Glucan endo-1,3-alpha-glucosidase agn1 [Elasticomyces elasticus]|nr:Glucan endo-1,3-alpha-glucosidase agn1 [Elasticomyces elasticus]